jgi:hypothetical protein
MRSLFHRSTAGALVSHRQTVETVFCFISRQGIRLKRGVNEIDPSCYLSSSLGYLRDRFAIAQRGRDDNNGNAEHDIFSPQLLIVCEQSWSK